MKIIEVINKASEESVIKCQPLRGCLMEVSKSTKIKSGFMKIAIEDKRADDLMDSDGSVGLILYIDRAVYNRLIQEETE